METKQRNPWNAYVSYYFSKFKGMGHTMADCAEAYHRQKHQEQDDEILVTHDLDKANGTVATSPATPLDILLDKQAGEVMEELSKELQLMEHEFYMPRDPEPPKVYETGYENWDAPIRKPKTKHTGPRLPRHIFKAKKEAERKAAKVQEIQVRDTKYKAELQGLYDKAVAEAKPGVDPAVLARVFKSQQIREKLQARKAARKVKK